MKIDAGSGGKKVPYIGDVTEWEQEVAIYNFAGVKLDDIDLDGFEKIRDSLPDIRRKLDVIIKRRRHEEAREEYQHDGLTDAESPTPPTEQIPQARVGKRKAK